MSKLRGAAVLGAFLILAGCGTPALVDPCSKSPCQNGGVCSVDIEGRTLCECAAGYTGLTCNVIEGLCEPNPCENGGVCSADGSSYSCACAAGYSGDRCQTVVTVVVPTSCSPNPCKNAGTCALVAGQVECTCAAGFTGPTCEVPASACSPNPCLNGGTCSSDAMGKPVCACVGDFGGATCSVYVPPGDLDLSLTSTLGRSCADGGDMVDYSVGALTSTTATLLSTPAAGCLAAGDEVLLINLQGTYTHIFNTGAWELLKIQSIAGATITFAVAKQRYYGDEVGDDSNLGVGPSKQRVVLQRVPRYPAIEVPAGRALTAAAWDGDRGGVFAMRLDGNASFAGAVTMAGKGYHGGVTNVVGSAGGQAGESLRGLGPIVRVPSTGGGGGGAGNCGMLGYGYSGGGGGHGAAGSAGAAALCSGLGGVAYGDPALGKIFLGSGGGAGGTPSDLMSSPSGGYGGAGGGIVIVLAGGEVSGNILASGQAGYGDAAECTLASSSTTDCWDTSGPGGGGAGGSILTRGTTSMGTRDITGGRGGDGVSATDAPGNGGDGSVGRASN